MTEQIIKVGQDNKLSLRKEDDSKMLGPWHKMRYLLVMFAGLGTGLMFMCRLVITVSIVGMVDHELIEGNQDDVINIETKTSRIASPEFEETNKKKIEKFPWNHETQQTIVASYMIMYTIPQIYTTKLGIRFGPRISLTIGLLICAISNGLIPLIAPWGASWVIFFRLVNGLGASAILSYNLNCIELWIPESEKSTCLMLSTFTSNALATAAPLIAGHLSSYHWKWSFYIPSAISIVFCALWYIIVRDNFAEIPVLTKKEIEYIDSKLFHETYPIGAGGSAISIFKSKMFYACAISWIIFENFHYGLLAFLVPDYLRKTLDVAVADNGLFNFIIQSGSLFAMFYAQMAVYFFRSVVKMDISDSRKMVFFLCNIGATLPLLYIASEHKHQLALFSLCHALQTGNDMIMIATVMEKYGQIGLGSLAFSVLNTIGCISVPIFSWIAGTYLDANGASQHSWSMIFYAICILSAINIASYTLFIDSYPLKLDKERGSEKRPGKLDGVEFEAKMGLSRQLSISSSSLCYYKMSQKTE